MNSSVKSGGSSATSTLTMTPGMHCSATSHHYQQPGSSTDTSPLEEAPIPAPRKGRPIMGGPMILMNKKKGMERDSLNSYDSEEDDSDEIFDEIVYEEQPKATTSNLR